MKSIIKVSNVSKKYKDKLALNKVSYDFIDGNVYLLYGTNGSGKSTFIKSILNLIVYDGEITHGENSIGYSPELCVFPDFISVKAFLINLARVRKIDLSNIEETIKSYLSYFNIEEVYNKYLTNLSKGMKQKINIIQSLIHKPDILILDEPSSGLDTLSKDKLIGLIKESSFKVVLIATHYVDDYSSVKHILLNFKEGEINL